MDWRTGLIIISISFALHAQGSEVGDSRALGLQPEGLKACGSRVDRHEKDRGLPTLLYALQDATPGERKEREPINRYDENHQILTGPCAVVDGRVNAISGAFFHTELDLTEPGTDLTLTRYYCSLSPMHKPVTDGGLKKIEQESQDLFQCWSWGHATLLYWRPHWSSVVIGDEQTGAKSVYDMKDKDEGKLTEEALKGWVNVLAGGIGANTDVHNDKLLHIRQEQEQWRHLSANGLKRCFRSLPGNHVPNEARQHQRDKLRYYWWHEDERVTPQGLSYRYAYEKAFHFQRVDLLSRSGLRMGSIQKLEPTSYSSSSGQWAHYKCSDLFNDFTQVVTSVECGHKPSISYEYKQFLWGVLSYARHPRNGKEMALAHNYHYTPLLCRIESPEGRYLKIDYIDELPKAWTHKGVGKHTPLGPNACKVRAILGPLGKGGEEKTKYAFEYKPEFTRVTDACKAVQEFHFDKERRLKKIESQGPSVHLSRHFEWDKGANEGRLLKQWASDSKGQTIFCKRFEYDARGNIVTEYFHGDFSGRSSRLKVDDSGHIQNDAEICVTRYDYSCDDYNLLLREKGRDGREVEYIYEPSSNRLMARLERLGNQIVKRHFYSYDDFGHRCYSSEDDGSSPDPSDWSDLLTRKIVRSRAYDSGPSIGLIREESACYIDLPSRREKPLYRKEYSYYENRLLKDEMLYVEGVDQPAVHAYEYDSHHNITLETMPSGATCVRSYDANGNKISEVGPDPRCRSEFVYDTMNRLIEKRQKYQDQDTQYQDTVLTTQYSYDLMNRLIKEVSAYGVVTELAYDALGRCIKKTMTSQLDEEGQPMAHTVSECYRYDDFGRMTQKIDALGYRENYAYNSLDQPLLEQKQGKGEIRHYYNIEGLKVETQLQSGVRETYRYDELGRMTTLDRFDEQGKLIFTQNLSYEGMLLRSCSDSEGKEETHFYDGAGRLIEKRVRGREQELIEQWEYDGLNRQTNHRQFSSDSEGDFIENSTRYDSVGNICEKIRRSSGGALLGREFYEFDSSGRLILEVKLTEGKLQEKRMSYNARGQLVKATDALGYSWIYKNRLAVASPFAGVILDCVEEYRPDGTRREDWKSPEGHVIHSKIFAKDGSLAYEAHYGYDIYGGATYRCERTLLPTENSTESSTASLGQDVITRVRFGPARQVSERLDAALSDHERLNKYSYDSMGRLVSLVRPSGTRLDYTYDGMGLLQRVVSSDATIDQTLEHDVYGRATKITQKDGSSTIRTYNVLGQVVGETLANGYSIQKDYDGLGRVVELQLPLGVRVNRHYEKVLLRSIALSGTLGEYQHRYMAYDDQGRIVRERLVGDLGDLVREYDALGRTTLTKTPFFKSSVASFDPMGRVLQLFRGFDEQESLCFSYDALGQLMTEQKGDLGCEEVVNYSYNSRQQRLSKNKQVYFNNILGELLDVTGEQLQQSEYDLDGRMISYQTTTAGYELEYDAWDHLTKVTVTPKSNLGNISLDKASLDKTSLVETVRPVTYSYSYDGFDRRVSRTTTQSNGQSTTLAYIYDDQFELGSIRQEQEQDHWSDFRLVGLRSQAETGDTLLVYTGGKAYATLLDLQGSLVGWVDLENSQLQAQCSYDAYGIATGDKLGPWGYVCKRVDEETGWIFYGKRYYIPEHGRWLTRDPKGEIDGSNLYAFLRNSPVYQWDLWGLESIAGVKPPVIINTTGDLNHLKASYYEQEITRAFAHFQEKYPEKTHGNAFLIAVVHDYDAPWGGFFNGIGNGSEECIKRVEGMAESANMNMMSIYCTKQQGWRDPLMIVSRNLFGRDVDRPEYEMGGSMYDLGLRFNGELGIGTFPTAAHSNGDHVALKATNYMSTKEHSKMIDISAWGGVGAFSTADSNFYKYENKIDKMDTIARMARTGLKSDRVEYINAYRGPGFQSHFIDADPYCGQIRDYFNNFMGICR